MHYYYRPTKNLTSSPITMQIASNISRRHLLSTRVSFMLATYHPVKDVFESREKLLFYFILFRSSRKSKRD